MKLNTKLIGLVFGISALVAACGRNDAEEFTRKKISRLEAAAGRFKADCGQFPSKAEDLSKNPGVTEWQGPYFKGILDPWGIPFQLEVVDGQLEIRSFGRDRKAKTQDDITN
jgi:hypothetical protein